MPVRSVDLALLLLRMFWAMCFPYRLEVDVSANFDKLVTIPE